MFGSVIAAVDPRLFLFLVAATSVFGIYRAIVVSASLLKMPFLLHPICMSFAVYLMGISISVKSAIKGYYSKLAHSLFMISAYGALCCALYAVFQSKQEQSKKHLVSYHSWAGVAVFATITFWATHSGGYLTSLMPFFKRIHKEYGVYLYLASICVIMSGWAKIDPISMIEQLVYYAVSFTGIMFLRAHKSAMKIQAIVNGRGEKTE